MIKYKKDSDQIVTLLLDMEARDQNVINHEIGAVFNPVLQKLHDEKRKGLLRGVIITSGKSTFLASGDLEYLYQEADPKKIYQFSLIMKTLFRQIEQPGVPVVAAINGDAISIGFEFALAAHYRIALNRSSIKLGLPEINLGMMPGNGGTVRLMWLLGMKKAYEVLTKGLDYTPEMALQEGLVDSLAESEEEMLRKAKSWILNQVEGRNSWDFDHSKIPAGTIYEPENSMFFRRITYQLAASQHCQIPAYQSIIDCLSDCSKVDFDTANRIESRYYANLLVHPFCKNMIKAFWFDRRSIQSGINRPKGFGKFRPQKVGVIGAGQMGSRIALACLKAGMKVVVKDVSKLIAEKARDYTRRQLQRLVEDRQLASGQFNQFMDAITTTDRPEDFSTCDIIVEAVFENESLKKKVTQEAGAFLDDYSIMASNTISIPITKLAEQSKYKEKYIGLHFFHPADEVPLVEVVKGAATSEETVARGFDFVRMLGKTPVIVKDNWGFFAGRVQNTYLLEGVTMLQEGISAALIENIGKQVGMPKGPLELADEIGLPIVLKYEEQAAIHYGSNYVQHPAVKVLLMMIQNHQRSGGGHNGFYERDGGQLSVLWPGLEENFGSRRAEDLIDELKARFIFAQVVEALWCLQEKVILSVPSANLGSIYGWGFPAFQGGVIQFIDQYGLAEFKSKCKYLADQYGPRFKLPKLLRQKLEEIFV